MQSENVYMSSGGFGNLDVIEIWEAFTSHGICSVEFSNGKLSGDFSEIIRPYLNSSKIMLHNYFPQPTKSFVLNLASQDKVIRTKSIEHVIKCLRISKKIGADYYAVHSGFLFDPKPSELGQVFSPIRLTDRDKAKETFVETLSELSEVAMALEVNILIENNVITTQNLALFSQNPLLGCNSDEILQILAATPKIGLLLDLAHLNVSAKTLDNEVTREADKLKEISFGYHLSENDGIADSNGPIDTDSWFWKHINPNSHFVTLEVYEKNIERLAEQIEVTKFKLNAT